LINVWAFVSNTHLDFDAVRTPMGMASGHPDRRLMAVAPIPRLALAVLALVLFLAPAVSGRSAVREPAWAGRFYPRDPGELRALLADLLEAAAKTSPAPPRNADLRALIMPHAGYVYSGATAAVAATAIDRGRFDRVLLLGPDHRVGFRNASLTAATHWRTPLGLTPVDRGDRLMRDHPDLFARVGASDRMEHSLEVILPFLQTRLPRFELLPAVVGPCDGARLAAALEKVAADRRTLLVVSTDLSHYLPYDAAVRRDRQTLDRIESLDPDWQTDQDNRSCGRYPVGVLLNLARRLHWRPRILHYSNSGDTAGHRDAVVGYAAVAFYGDRPMSDPTPSTDALSPEQGHALVALARLTLADHFGVDAPTADSRSLDEQLADAALQARCGTFVTLKIDGQLRGCIGSLTAAAPLVTGVRDNALNAALHDPRFAPLKASELASVRIEVSVLTDPAPLAYTDADDLLARLRPGIDGVIIKKGFAGATFLPQVWDQLPQPDSFLSNLCRKAGLPADQWRRGDLAVQTYQVQYFEEAR
jgi:AmmeMemoRadiSam system protein B/AmmeMemoRadiSam system protein A